MLQPPDADNTSDNGLVLVNVNSDFVISIGTSDLKFTASTSEDRKVIEQHWIDADDKKLPEKHWSSKSSRSRMTRQRHSELPYYVPQPHSITRRHSTENWTTSEVASFDCMCRTAERLISASTDCSTSTSSSASHSFDVNSALSGNASNGERIEGGHFLVADPGGRGGRTTVKRSRSLGDLSHPCRVLPAVSEAPEQYYSTLQNDLAIDRIELKLRDFHVT